MAGWHHWLDGCESKWTLGVGDGQGGLACCDSWGLEESDTTATELKLCEMGHRITALLMINHCLWPKHSANLIGTHDCGRLIFVAVVVWLLSRVQLFAAPLTAACWASLSFTVSWNCSNSCPWVSDSIQSPHPPLPSSPPALNLSQHPDLF